MDIQKLIRYIQGSLDSKQDLKEVLDWIEISPDNQKEYNELKKLWVLTGFANTKDISRNKSCMMKRNRFRQAVSFLQKNAAVFVLSFMLGGISVYLLKEKEGLDKASYYNEVYVPKGEKSMVTLYDGTVIRLNSGSILRYPVIFRNDNREVYIEGEAYFDVAENKAKPFIVKTENINVKVLGTRFNVYAYPEEPVVCATLEKGAVEVTLENSNNRLNMKPGQQFLYCRTERKYQLKDVDTRLHTSWINNILRFENTCLHEILKKMERWYDVKIEIEEGFNLNERFTVSIKTESLKEILDMLSITTNLDYEIKENVVRITKKRKNN